jgi:hypothetical protein
MVTWAAWGDTKIVGVLIWADGIRATDGWEVVSLGTYLGRVGREVTIVIRVNVGHVYKHRKGQWCKAKRHIVKSNMKRPRQEAAFKNVGKRVAQCDDKRCSKCDK